MDFLHRRWKRILLIGSPVLLIAVVAFFGQCEVHAWRHEPAMAADSAVTFAERAFVQRDVEGAYVQVLPALAAEVSAQQAGEIIEGLHADGRPDSVEAIEYQPTPGYKGMIIFLVGHSGDATFYYRFQMEGTASSGYQVAGFWRGGPGPYPDPENRSPLPGNRN